MRSFLSFIIFIVCLTLGFSASTYWVLSELGGSVELGEPLFTLGVPIYPPYMSIVWEYHFGEFFREVFLVSWLINVGGVLLSVFSTLVFRLFQKEEEDVLTTYGSSRFATVRELKETGLLNNKGVILGLDDLGNYLRDSSNRHIKVFAPTRSGKGVGIVIPTLLTYEESVLVFDPKSENWINTSGFRSKFSKVIAFNPTSEETHFFNPLLEIRKGINEVKDVQNIAEIIVDPNGKGELDHWQETAKSLLVGAILHTLYTEREPTLRKVSELLSHPKRTIEETLEIMCTASHLSDGTTHPQVAHHARTVLNKAFEERSGVYSSAVKTLALFEDPLLSNATSKSSFTISEFISGEKPLSLYLIVPASDITRLQPIIRIIINQICKRLTEKLDYDFIESENQTKIVIKKNKYELLLLLDEFPVLGRLEFFESSLAYMAQYGLKALIISQSYSQLLKAYGKDTSIIDNCHIRLFHAPNSIETAELISKMLGQATRKRKYKNFGGNRLSVYLGHVTEGENEIARSLLTATEVMELPNTDEIIFISNLPPIRCKKIFYYSDPNFYKRIKTPPKFESTSIIESINEDDDIIDSKVINLEELKEARKKFLQNKSQIKDMNLVENKVINSNYFLDEKE